MPHEQTTTFTVRDDGKLQGETAGETLIRWISDTLKLFAGGRVEFSIRRPKRTLRQNRRYWAMLSDIAEGFRKAGVTELHMVGPDGEMISVPVTKDLVHAYYKNKYLTPKEPGKEPSTTRLDQTEMSDYMEKLRHDEDVRKLDISWREEDELAYG